ncbi:MAG: hypothetical protein AUI50_09000 [Crenarchaeota archaeon 13_1_40CM_2_52_14]|nr:MAG: hypothetical protein AUI97_04090 [Crenarchaeota archaeon 13_1_40CM_3_52_17]OLD33891.1 MAG: hypothetical protein AUI50_09000 [Crenarchaeota archaeon 13_1_40CM_2_52_14]
MSSKTTCDSLYRPDVGMVAIFDLDADAIVLFVEGFHVALDIGEELVEPVFVSGNLLSQKIL